MRKILSLFLFALAATASAQVADDPVIMTINGKPVTRAEFEYSYNKNDGGEETVEQKTVDEYVDMFINYKLKVEAALETRYDTTEAFRKEFLQYRDMQLTGYMVDDAYIDSVARYYYEQNVKFLDGHDLVRPAHILLFVKQGATDEEKAAVKARIDSIYAALQGGADFGETARQCSEERTSAQNGGQLGWMAPNKQLQVFMDECYKLQPGQMSAPFEAPYGYQIVKMTERKPYGSYEQESPDLIKALKLQDNIEEKSANARIDRMVAQSGGRLTREAVLDSVLAAHIDSEPALKYLVQEYHDGLLLYEMQKQRVFDPAKEDVAQLEATFKKNRKQYAWDEPRFKGFIVHSNSKKLIKHAKKLLKKHADGDWKTVIKETFNKDSVTVMVSGPYLAKKGDNRYIDQHVFGGEKIKAHPKFAYNDVQGKKIAQPQTYKDVKSLVEADLQSELEKVWIEELRAKYPVTVNRDVVLTVNNH
ncbi:MAG: peptidylprolyl isomerase [Alloprevotella sp.]|nr:peptidylprolyl isomerase [Alloprevotella sp.]